MATIVERPLSAFSMSASTTVVPQRRSRNSVEIIDVDSFEEVEERPAQRRRVEPEPQHDVIEVFDSDDEFSGDASGEGSSRSGGDAPRQHVAGSYRAARNRYFSPPAPFQDETIPPVPPLPRRFSSFASLPLPRPRAPRGPPPPSSNLNVNEGSSSSSSRVPGPIRPISQPFPFELFSSPPAPALSPPRRPVHARARARASADDDFDFRPAPPARHNPPMGLGGALISSNNARLAAERLERQHRNERRVAGGRVAPAIALAGGSGSGSNHRHAAPGNSIMRRLASLNPFRWGDGTAQRVNEVDLLALAHPAGGDARTHADAQLALDLYLADQEDAMAARFHHPARAFARRELALLRGWAGGASKDDEDYKKEWTHSGSADGGFVFDFAPSEIVPAVTGKGKGKEVVIDVDAEKESVSTLLVCARCLDPLLVRSDGITDGGEEEARRRKVWGLRCGHLIDGKCFEELRRPVGEEPAPTQPTDDSDTSPNSSGKGKGKGKGRARDEDEDEEHDSLFDEEPPTSIRSRLRSRGTVTSSAMPGAFEIAVPLPRHKKRALPKRKSKAKPKKPVVEARYEWACPVAGCGRLHGSEKIAGEWVNSSKNGPIGVFV
ncbi:hypothetical protein C8R43DRAFT_1135384 [Mycena crocata]|nr:hypothetical protein C8R43DRAFT_1135384 [Mycena crocata]